LETYIQFVTQKSQLDCFKKKLLESI